MHTHHNSSHPTQHSWRMYLWEELVLSSTYSKIKVTLNLSTKIRISRRKLNNVAICLPRQNPAFFCPLPETSELWPSPRKGQGWSELWWSPVWSPSFQTHSLKIIQRQSMFVHINFPFETNLPQPTIKKKSRIWAQKKCKRAIEMLSLQ